MAARNSDIYFKSKFSLHNGGNGKKFSILAVSLLLGHKTMSFTGWAVWSCIFGRQIAYNQIMTMTFTQINKRFVLQSGAVGLKFKSKCNCEDVGLENFDEIVCRVKLTAALSSRYMRSQTIVTACTLIQCKLINPYTYTHCIDTQYFNFCSTQIILLVSVEFL